MIQIWKSRKIILPEERASALVINATPLPALSGKLDIGLVKSGSIMLRNIKPAKFYRIRKEDVENSATKPYNMLVVETEDGELVELLFSDKELQNSIIRRRCNTKIIPRYTLGCSYSVSGRVAFIISLLSFLLGYFVKTLI